jgi:hypothetical protein
MNFDQVLASNLLTPNNYKGLVLDRCETAYAWNNNRRNMQVLVPAYTNAVLLPTCNNRIPEHVPSPRMQQTVANVNQDNMCFSGLNTSIRNDHCISSCALKSVVPERSQNYTKHSEKKESNVDVGTLELTETVPYRVPATTLHIDWCTDKTFHDYRFVIERKDPHDMNKEPDSISSACKDIDVCFDDENQRIIIRYKYIQRNGRETEGTIDAPYLRPRKPFEDHEHIDQKKAVEQFLKSFAVNTGEEKQGKNGEERLFKNYTARTARHTPVHELSSDPKQIDQEVLLLQEKWEEIQDKLNVILKDHADMNDLIKSILSLHWRMT